MSTYVIDTHALLWYFTDSPRLGPDARDVLQNVAAGETTLLVPVIVVAELIYVVEKGRASIDIDAIVSTLQASHNVHILPFDVDRALDLRTHTSISGIHDRMIVAEAIARAVPLITRDEEITSSGVVDVVW